MNNPFEGQLTKQQSIGRFMAVMLMCIPVGIGLSYAISFLLKPAPFMPRLMSKPPRALPPRDFDDDSD